ncbi:hypothetical protein [Paenibacillus xylaniclasticus]|uniref:hypothetical protein n=1 Tax=Paenibacillus xylaniclasticus TaxID=588083 RepID=UPI000FD7DCE9|nr:MULTISPECIES: hypothetical protein [Paenibacillus]GFN34136.1 hypothetical protein PCURB6_43960 [Paenibacillus curdlanolyticus]
MIKERFNIDSPGLKFQICLLVLWIGLKFAADIGFPFVKQMEKEKLKFEVLQEELKRREEENHYLVGQVRTRKEEILTIKHETRLIEEQTRLVKEETRVMNEKKDALHKETDSKREHIKMLKETAEKLKSSR